MKKIMALHFYITYEIIYSIIAVLYILLLHRKVKPSEIMLYVIVISSVGTYVLNFVHTTTVIIPKCLKTDYVSKSMISVRCICSKIPPFMSMEFH